MRGVNIMLVVFVVLFHLLAEGSIAWPTGTEYTGIQLFIAQPVH